MKPPYLVVLGIVLLAAALRLYSAVEHPYEQDELYTVEESTNLFQTRLHPGIQARPLFYHIMHPIVTELPQTPLVLRALPLLFGIAGVWAMWLLASRSFGSYGGSAAALLAALSPWHLHASAFARYYSLVFLLAAFVYYLFPRAVDEDSPRWYLATAALLFAGAFTHPSFVFPVAGAGLVFMAVRANGTLRLPWPSPRAWRYLWGPFLLGAAALVITIRVVHGSAAPDNGTSRGLLATLRLVPAIVDWISPVVAAAAAVGVALVIAQRWTLQDRESVSSIRVVAAVTVGVCATLISLTALSFRTAIYADYGIAALPLVFLGAAALVDWVSRNVAPPRSAFGAVAVTTVLVAGVLPSTLSHLSDGTRFDYRPAYEAIMTEDPAHPVWTWPVALAHHYAPDLTVRELPYDPVRFDSLLHEVGEVWVVASVKRFGIAMDDSGLLAAKVAERCRRHSSHERLRFDYRLYRVELWRCSSTTRASDAMESGGK